MMQPNFPILPIRVQKSSTKPKITLNDFRFGATMPTAEQMRQLFWEDIKVMRVSPASHNLKVLKGLAANPQMILCVADKSLADVIIRAASFIAYLDSLNPLNYVNYGGEDSEKPMSPDEYYEYLQSLGIKLNLVK
ncbi:hypothetical protein [Planktothrix tepida]|nr:hypothetical protein [Planktothrix tepida]